MTSVITTKKLGGNIKGATLEVSPGAAAYLISRGDAEAVQEAPKTSGRKGKAAPEVEPEGSTEAPGGASPEAIALTGGFSSFPRSEEHTSELQSPLIIAYAVFCLRSEERRVGKECRIGCRSRWSPYH